MQMPIRRVHMCDSTELRMPDMRPDHALCALTGRWYLTGTPAVSGERGYPGLLRGGHITAAAPTYRGPHPSTPR